MGRSFGRGVVRVDGEVVLGMLGMLGVLGMLGIRPFATFISSSDTSISTFFLPVPFLVLIFPIPFFLIPVMIDIDVFGG
jgi:hypothetical protein